MLSAEANDLCEADKKKTITPGHILRAMEKLGLERTLLCASVVCAHLVSAHFCLSWRRASAGVESVWSIVLTVAHLVTARYAASRLVNRIWCAAGSVGYQKDVQDDFARHKEDEKVCVASEPVGMVEWPYATGTIHVLHRTPSSDVAVTCPF